MTVHAIMVKAEKPNIPEGQARQEVHSVLENHPKVLEDEQVDLTYNEGTPPTPEHAHLTMRFPLSVTKTVLLNNVETALQQVMDWYIVGYHGCTHDGTGGGCAVNERREWGPVPQEVTV